MTCDVRVVWSSSRMDPHLLFLWFVRSAVKKGANRVMKKAGFKRPGGGRRFLRDVGAFHQQFDYAATWLEGEVGELQLRLSVTSPGHREPGSSGSCRSTSSHKTRLTCRSPCISGSPPRRSPGSTLRTKPFATARCQSDLHQHHDQETMLRFDGASVALGEPPRQRRGRGLRAVVDLQRAHDARDVHAHRRLRDAE